MLKFWYAKHRFVANVSLSVLAMLAPTACSDTEDFGDEEAVDRVSSPVIATNGTCGNGVVESPEQCDDGNGDDEDNCKNDCTFARRIEHVVTATCSGNVAPECIPSFTGLSCVEGHDSRFTYYEIGPGWWNQKIDHTCDFVSGTWTCDITPLAFSGGPKVWTSRGLCPGETDTGSRSSFFADDDGLTIECSHGDDTACRLLEAGVGFSFNWQLNTTLRADMTCTYSGCTATTFNSNPGTAIGQVSGANCTISVITNDVGPCDGTDGGAGSGP